MSQFGPPRDLTERSGVKVKGSLSVVPVRSGGGDPVGPSEMAQQGVLVEAQAAAWSRYLFSAVYRDLHVQGFSIPSMWIVLVAQSDEVTSRAGKRK